MLFGVEKAQKRFEELMARATAGEEIVIGEGERLAKLVPVGASHLQARRLDEKSRPVESNADVGEDG